MGVQVAVRFAREQIPLFIKDVAKLGLCVVNFVLGSGLLGLCPPPNAERTGISLMMGNGMMENLTAEGNCHNPDAIAWADLPDFVKTIAPAPNHVARGMASEFQRMAGQIDTSRLRPEQRAEMERMQANMANMMGGAGGGGAPGCPQM